MAMAYAKITAPVMKNNHELILCLGEGLYKRIEEYAQEHCTSVESVLITATVTLINSERYKEKEKLQESLYRY